MSQSSGFKEYLGDGLYVDFDGYQIWLTSENGIEILDRVALEPAVYKALTEYVARRLTVPVRQP